MGRTYTHSPKYVYPAVFKPEANGMFSIRFPDIENCCTCGDNLEDGMVMAEDALALTVFTDYEEKSISAPEATPIDKIKLKKREFVTYIVCDTTRYRRKFSSKAVKKTLSIPEWLNDAAVKERINFSQVLQDALKEKLNVS
ncbi:MAG: type II toxin-antitoxin system HicB family antitoxin [Clostridiales bacterium]|nr:type II toxin-antitoxin system HicB family antitoxin [Clostridiales bacterium]